LDDLKTYAPVVVLGRTVAKTLFPDGGSPVGKYVLLRNVPFLVVGVMSEKGASPNGNDQDDVIFVPINTGLVRLFGKSYLSSITVKVADTSDIDATQAAIETLLKARHRTEDFSVRNMASILQAAMETQDTFTLLLGTVAAISLLVGGIGVMNIMLVSARARLAFAWPPARACATFYSSSISKRPLSVRQAGFWVFLSASSRE
jgi:macrolide transport system ATP-binding/permease protein